MVLDATLLNTQYYKVRIKGKVEQSRGRSSALPYIFRKGSLRVTLEYGRQLYLLINKMSFGPTFFSQNYPDEPVAET